jgi:hypothetical protein
MSRKTWSVRYCIPYGIVRPTCGLAASRKRVASEAPTKRWCPARRVDRIQSLYSLERTYCCPCDCHVATNPFGARHLTGITKCASGTRKEARLGVCGITSTAIHAGGRSARYCVPYGIVSTRLPPRGALRARVLKYPLVERGVHNTCLFKFGWPFRLAGR